MKTLIQNLSSISFGSVVVISLMGCGSGGSGMLTCTPTGFNMLVGPANPGSAAPDHTAAPPGNQKAFVAATGSEIGPGCASTQLYQPTHAQWATSDTKNVSISSANDATNGVATCLGATAPGGATISATVTMGKFTQTVSSAYPLICK